MRRIFFILAMVSFVHGTVAQKSTAYFYTAASERYLSDAAIDSMLYTASAAIFEEHKIPSSLLQEKYPYFKSNLAALARNETILLFTLLERRNQTSKSLKGSVEFIANKKMYETYFSQTVRSTFNKNQSLKRYLSFNNSDRITFFNSTVRILPNGKLLVTEKISVYNGDGKTNSLYGRDARFEAIGGLNDDIKRGIVRAFPLYYFNEHNLFQNTAFQIKEVLRNGEPEQYHTEKKDNGILVYTGNSNTFLENGYYTYSLTYETDHQLKNLDEFDELYWNVTGTGWVFRIDSASCTIIFPKGSSHISSKCYTGAGGSKDENCSFTLSGDSLIIFKTTGPLLPYTGLTIASSFSKGFVKRPGMFELTKYYTWNNKAVFFLPIAALMSALFCFIWWLRVGRDPAKGTVYPLFAPPAGYSPAALGYIYEQKYERRFTAATIVDAAVRNKLRIAVERVGLLIKHNRYVISSSDKASTPPYTHYDDYDRDVKDLVGTKIEKGKFNSSLGDLDKKIMTDCEKRFKNKDGSISTSARGFFSINSKYTVLPVIICIVAAGWGFFDGVIPALKMRNFWQAVFYAGGIILCVIVVRVFARLLKAYTVDGRKMADKIEGFRMFLVTADAHRFDLMNPTAKTMELYEKYLPFAIALNCEIAWGEQFEKIIGSAYLDGSVNSGSVFAGSFRNSNGSFSSSFASSFSGAISSASTPPSSSSGGGSSFGGGSSGGGGGGGGGGGW